MEEKYRPTAVLQKNLRAAGEMKPSVSHEAHHIICCKGRWDQAAVMRARISMVLGLTTLKMEFGFLATLVAKSSEMIEPNL